MDLSKNNSFLTEEAINYISRTEKRKNVPVCEMLEMHPLRFCPLLSWKLMRGRSTTCTPSKFKLFCQ